MIRVVVDTNVVISATLKSDSIPASILDLAARGTIAVFVSREMVTEYETVLRRPRLRLDLERVEYLSIIRTAMTLIQPTERLTVCSHEPDNRFVECAVAASAEYPITGNTKHFPA